MLLTCLAQVIVHGIIIIMTIPMEANPLDVLLHRSQLLEGIIIIMAIAMEAN